jgi:DNA-binding NtrC family response regulator
MLLLRSDYAVKSFASYPEAEGCLEQEDFDFLILNQGGPVFEPHRLVALVIARNRNTPVVVLTRCLQMKSYLEAMQLGAADYLENPVTPAEFECTVMMHCQPRRGEISAQAS